MHAYALTIRRTHRKHTQNQEKEEEEDGEKIVNIRNEI